jgi:uncharacterized protein (DUF2225 family)
VPKKVDIPYDILYLEYIINNKTGNQITKEYNYDKKQYSAI